MLVWIAFALLVSCAQSPPLRDAAEFAKWTLQAVAGKPSLRAVSAPKPMVVWASGSGGTVLRTVDGGASWMRVPPLVAEGLDFRCIVAFDEERALLATAGSPARVYRTTDGGTTWAVVFEDPRAAAFFDAMAFSDASRGYLVGDPIDGLMQWFETEDGGASWRAVPPPFLPAPAPGEAMFAASCSALLAHGDGVFLVTGGAACRFLLSSARARGFTQQSLPLLHGEPSQGAFSFARCRDRAFVVVGGDYRAPDRCEGSACWSDDGGETWHNSVGEPGYRSAVVAIGSDGLCVATGPGGTSLSHDFGRSWSSLSADGFHALAVCEDRLYAVGSEGRIGSTFLVGAALHPAQQSSVQDPLPQSP